MNAMMKINTFTPKPRGQTGLIFTLCLLWLVSAVAADTGCNASWRHVTFDILEDVVYRNMSSPPASVRYAKSLAQATANSQVQLLDSSGRCYPWYSALVQTARDTDAKSAFLSSYKV